MWAIIEWDSIDLSKHYVTNQYHPARYLLYPRAGKFSGWQKTVVYLFRTRKQHMFYNDIKQIQFIKKKIQHLGPIV